MRVDHARHWPFTAQLGIQRERCGRCLFADQRVDHDDAGVALDEADHREVEPAGLIDAGCDLEESVLRQQLTLAPQACAGGVGRRSVEELVGIEVPHNSAICSEHLALRATAEKAALGIVKILGVVHGKLCGRFRHGLARCRRHGGFDGHTESLPHSSRIVESSPPRQVSSVVDEATVVEVG